MMLRVDVGVRVDQRVAHAGLRGEVDDAIEAFSAAKSAIDGRAVGDVELARSESPRASSSCVSRASLSVDVVVVVQVVEPDDGVAALEQAPRDVHADEAGGAGDEDFHAVTEFTGSS